MNCPRCGTANSAGRRFCAECGSALALACPSCGFSNEPGVKFCGGCGAVLGASPVTGEPRFVSPETYTPGHLAEKILTSKRALEGERKQVTVLFADLKGSMELLADRDPEEARTLLDPVLEHMMEAVHHYEGTVNQVMGDGIMALFGAPLAHEDHAVRACYAALRMQESVQRYAERARRAHGVNVQIRVGLNSGAVVVRSIGSDLHMDYTAVGQTTHLAARMEQLASPGSILLTRATLALVEGLVAVKPLGPVPVKGFADPVEVYEVTGAGPARTRLQATARRGLTRFVGRDAELEQLRRAQQLAANGHGQVAAILGEAGVGKSRLVYEFSRSHRLNGWLALEIASVSYGKATSYLPVINLLKGYFKIQDRDDLREIREKVTGKLLTLDRALEPTLPALLALLHVPTDDVAWQTLDPGQRRDRTLDAVRRLLLREEQEQPLLLIFEDLHWIDGETQALLDSLVESLGSARLLLLVTYRPEYRHRWAGKELYSQMRLDALPAESAAELLEALLGEDPGLAPLKQLLVRRGNPFFLEETVRTLAETGALSGKAGAYRLTRPIQTIDVPATVQVILAARIDRLPAEDKQLLQTASVIGKDVPFVLLHAVSGAAEDAVHRGLTRLKAAEFMYESRPFPDPAYTFKHALTHEVAYGSLLQERRRALHARTVEAMERLYEGRRAEHVEGLAHHAFHGALWAKAVAYLRETGARAAARSANREAVAFFERALAALAHLPEDRTVLLLGVDLRFDLKTALTPLAEWSRIFDCLRDAEVLALRLDDQPRLGRVSAYTSDCARVLGDHELAIETGTRALAIAQAGADPTLEVNANTYLGLAHYARGSYRAAIDFFRRNVVALEGDRVRERFEMAQPPAVHSRVWLACCLAELGEFTDALTRSEEALALATSIAQPLSLSVANFGSGQVRLVRGDFLDAIRALERGLELSHSWRLQLWSLNIAAALGSAYARSGQGTAGVGLLEDAIKRSEAMLRSGLHSARIAALAEAVLLGGDNERAAEAARRALDLARENGERGCEAWALHVLGETAASRFTSSRADTAGDHQQRALALAEELGMAPLAARCWLALGRLHRRTSGLQRAEAALGTAAGLFRRMGMRFWLEQAEAELLDRSG
jgi:class 3 adenylate cyclase/tetratricopeptide (TPR) repeat protein